MSNSEADYKESQDSLQPNPKPSKIRILTYNFFIRPPGVHNTGDDYKDERIEIFKNYLKDYDIICFQELFNIGHRRPEKMLTNGQESGYAYTVLSPKPSFFDWFKRPLENAGVATMSRYNMIDTQFRAFKYFASVDRFVMKGVLYTEIELPNGHH